MLRKNKTTCTLILPARLSPAEAPEVTQALRTALAEAKPLTVESKKLEHIDTLSLQALLVGCRSLQHNGCEISVNQPADALFNTLNQLGLTLEAPA